MTATNARRRATIHQVLAIGTSTLLLGLVGALTATGGVMWVRRGRATRDRVVAVAALLLLVTGVAWLAAIAPDRLTVGAFLTLADRDWIDALARAAVALLPVALVAPDETIRARDRVAEPEATDPDGAGGATGGPGTTAPSRRLGEVDRLRAVAIVAVVLIHGLQFRPPVTAYIDLWLSDVLRFAVPTLLFVSGWLAPRTPTGVTWLLRRVRRILPPYLLASVLVLALARVSPLLDARPVVEALLTASAIGPYYYVAVLVILTLVTPLLQRLPSRGRWALLGVATAVALGIEVADLPLRVRQYLPLTWLPYYLAGFQLRPLRDLLARTQDITRSVVLIGGLVLVVATAFAPVDTPLREALAALTIWGVLGNLLLATLAVRPQPHDLTRTLSGQSYLIYLYHAPVVAGVAGAFGSPVLSLRPVIAVAVALVTCLAAGALTRFVWPHGARRWLGA